LFIVLVRLGWVNMKYKWQKKVVEPKKGVLVRHFIINYHWSRCTIKRLKKIDDAISVLDDNLAESLRYLKQKKVFSNII
jgi:hypothetical protein